MKGKTFWLVLVSFIPASIYLTVATNAFFLPISIADVIAAAVILIVCLYLVWAHYVEKPAGDLITAVNRAIRGDYQARFSCCDENDTFGRISKVYNQFLSCVENQMEELQENRRMQSRMYENEKIYRSALELSCERIFEADLTHNRVVYGQEMYQKAFPFLSTRIYNDMVESIAESAVFDEDRQKFLDVFSRRCLLEKFKKTAVPEISTEYRVKNSTGGFYWACGTVILLNGEEGDSLKVVGYVKNVDARKKHDLEILQQSQKDGLTGLYNKKTTQTMVTEMLECGEGRNAAIMVDIDNFKHINDTLGHMQGDLALMRVAQKLQRLFRSTDIVGRIGGDEFFIFLKNYPSEDMLIDRLEKVGDIFRQIQLSDSGFHVSGSIGVALYPEDGRTYDELYKKADISLYYSKAHGKDRFYFYGGRFGEKYGVAPLKEIPAASGYAPVEKPIDFETRPAQAKRERAKAGVSVRGGL